MINILKQCLWQQFGASIDMVKNAVAMWPNGQWETSKRFFYMAYHVSVFLDYYLTIPWQNFTSPLPFTFTGPADLPVEAIDDVVPNRIYDKTELLAYLDTSREKCRILISGLTEEKLCGRWIEDFNDGMDYAVLEILLYNMRHVQHHAAQLNLLLRQQINDAPRWVAKAGNGL